MNSWPYRLGQVRPDSNQRHVRTDRGAGCSTSALLVEYSAIDFAVGASRHGVCRSHRNPRDCQREIGFCRSRLTASDPNVFRL